MSNQIYIDSSISNAQMTIGLNNASTIILGNTNCTTTTYLLNVSNICTNSLDTNASGTLNIGNTNASMINIGTLGTGTINIGKANMSTVINGPLTTNGLINASGGFQSPIPIRPTYTSLPSFETTQIGYTISNVILTNVSVGASNNYLNPFSTTTFSLSIGVWLVYWQLRITVPVTASTVSSYSVASSLATQQNNINNYGLTWSTLATTISSSGNFCINGSIIIRNSTPNNLLTPSILFVYNNGIQYMANDTYFIVTRIA
jgi:hypothetical protein